MPRAAVVLAGGAISSPRRGGGWEDKALATVEGEPVVARVVKSVLELVDFVFVITKRGWKTTLMELLRPVLGEEADLVRVIEDAPHPGGPLCAIGTALRKCYAIKKFKAEACVVLPCDIPFLKPEAVELLLRGTRNADVSVFVWSSGSVEPLPAGVRVDRAYAAVSGLCNVRRRKLTDMARAVETARFVHVESEVTEVDPELHSFVNLSEPSDLETPRPRVPKSRHVAVRGSFTLQIAKLPLLPAATVSVRSEEDALSSYIMLSTSPFWRGVLGEQYGRVAHDINSIAEAAGSFEEEARSYERAGLVSLAAHALLDAARCWRDIEELDKAAELDSRARSLFDLAGL